MEMEVVVDLLQFPLVATGLYFRLGHVPGPAFLHLFLILL